MKVYSKEASWTWLNISDASTPQHSQIRAITTTHDGDDDGNGDGDADDDDEEQEHKEK